MEEDDKASVLVWISADGEYVPEMRELCRSAGYSIEAEVRQNRKEPDPRYYLGPGKIEEVGGTEGVNFIVVPSDLTPSQSFNIGKVTGLVVVDRIRMILELFRRRASSPEARLQVELADLEHQLPILNEYIHKGTLSDRPGFLGGGEYKVDYYYEMAKKRMAQIRRKLRLQRQRRKRKRQLRKRRGAHLVALGGYTNAGKSTLLNRLIEGDEEKMTDVGPLVFTTIATTARRMKGDRNCIVTDTVGFIRDLPPWLIEGFMSTLEEVFEADVILLVIDASEGKEMIERKLSDSIEILRRKAARGNILLVLNKADMISGPEREELRKELYEKEGAPAGNLDGFVMISARTGEGIDNLMDMIDEQLPSLLKVRFEIPLTDQGKEVLSLIRDRDEKVEVEYQNMSAFVSAELEERWCRSIGKKAKKIGGSFVIIEDAGKDD